MFNKTEISSLSFNVFDRFDKDWSLLTVGDTDKNNAMTISWGTMGVLWNKKIVTVFVRPTRHTNKLMKENDTFSLQFFKKEDKKILVFCGRNSGRDYDKVKHLNLTSLMLDDTLCFEEAEMIITCKKIYTDSLKSDNFIDKSIFNNYSEELKDYHDIYIGEIINIYTK